MQIRFKATSRDIGALLRYSIRHSHQFWIRLGVSLLYAPAVLTLRAVWTGERLTSFDVVAGLAIGTLSALGIVWAVFGRNKDGERLVSIEPQGIETCLGRVPHSIAWTRVEFVREMPEYIFISSKSGDTFAVPSRAFASGTERAEFLRQIAHYSRAAI